jgi:hypothetical protein
MSKGSETSNPSPGPSPGPGWWLAADGNWYPQRWEYRWETTGASGLDASAAMAKMVETAYALGREGWEMVNYTVQSHQAVGVGEGPYVQHQSSAFRHEEWSVTCFMKRPLAPHEQQPLA